MAIGYLEDVQFNVSDKEVLTFKDLSHSSSAKFHAHEVIGNKPLSEFLSCDLDKLTLSIELHHSLGVDVLATIEKLKAYEQEGKPLEFVLASTPLGVDKWVIESSSRAYNNIYSNGVCMFAKVDLNLAEYISDTDLQPNKTVKRNTSPQVINVVKTSLMQSYAPNVSQIFNILLNTIL